MAHSGDINQEKRHKILVSLFSGRILSFAGRSIVGIFFPIFFYELFGERVLPVIAFFFFVHLTYGFFVTPGAQLLNRIGFRYSLLLGVLFAALYTAVLYVLDQFAQPDTLLLFTIAAFLVAVAYRTFFWTPFHTEFGKYTDRKSRGTQVGILVGVVTIVGALAPAIGGYVTSEFGYHILFLISIGVTLLATIPFSRTPRYDEVFSWSYAKTFREFFARENRQIVLTSALAGIDNILGAIIWPLFIFVLLDGEYLDVGIISSLIVAATALFQFALGRFLDRVPKGRLLRAGSIFSAVGWAIKIFISTASQVFVVGIYHNIAKSSISTSYSAFFYEIAADGEHYIDEYTVIRGMAISFGKAVALGSIGVLLLLVPLQWTFLIGVASALLLSLVLSRATDPEQECLSDRSC